jgi:lysophospholipase L1-like esterase
MLFKTVVSVIFMLLLLQGCGGGGGGSSSPSKSTTVNILPFGDSITKGIWVNDSRPNSQVTGYRAPLWHLLTNNGYKVNFVGTQVSGQGVEPPFDPEHEGRPNWKSTELADIAYDVFAGTQPGIVLIHAGTNDRTTTNPAGVLNILDELEAYEEKSGKEITAVVALIINRRVNDGRHAIFNTRLNEALAQRIKEGDSIIVADMYSQAGLTAGDYEDNTHPNDAGYAKMANVWFNHIKKAY